VTSVYAEGRPPARALHGPFDKPANMGKYARATWESEIMGPIERAECKCACCRWRDLNGKPMPDLGENWHWQRYPTGEQIRAAGSVSKVPPMSRPVWIFDGTGMGLAA